MRRYRAFISYSWSDRASGEWLHQALESYRTPSALVGRQTPFGPVPKALHPIFRDREEQAAGASLGTSLDAALADSEFLIVICSPRSAQSQWVNHEIAWFKTNRDPAKVLALIVDGEPGSREAECFPPALTHRIEADLTVSVNAEDTPLAADARDSGDGKRRAKLKLVAAMLGVGLDELVNRDERRRALRTRIIVGSSLALAAVMSVLAWVAVQARNEADHQRAEADGLVEFMLTDLREKLQPVGRLDALDVVGQRALKYYAGQRPGDLDADALGRRSRALHMVGEIRNIRGDSAAGLTAFRQAAATTSELLARDPDNSQRIFDHAQSVFWVGYIAYERGELQDAEAQFREYKRLADHLMALDPKKPEWQMERSYAESNLAILLYDQGRYAEAEPAFANALKIVEAVASGENHNTARQLEIGTAINWLGKARSALNRTGEAKALHGREIAVYQDVLKVDPANTQATMRMAVAWQHVGRLEEIQGHADVGSAAFGSSLSLMAKLLAIEPTNTEWQETELRALIAQVDNLILLQQFATARAVYRTAQSSLGRMIAADSKNAIWSIGLRSSLEVRGAQLALAEGNAAAAIDLAQGAARRLAWTKELNRFEAAKIGAEAAIIAGDGLARLGRQAEAQGVWQSAIAELSATSLDNVSSILCSRFLLLKRLGNTAEATRIARELDGQGYRHPAYLREK